MPAPRKRPLELMERGARMVLQMRTETGACRGAVARAAKQLGVHSEGRCCTWRSRFQVFRLMRARACSARARTLRWVALRCSRQSDSAVQSRGLR
jgi:hypothetical protein